MNQYLRERDRVERLISDDTADLGKRIEAVVILLQHPLPAGLRFDLSNMFLLWSDEYSQEKAA